MIALQQDVLSPSSLSVDEKNRFMELQIEVERNLTGFLRCGAALLEIRTKKLYRENYATFSEFVRDRFGLARSTADQLCRSTQVYETLSANAELADTPVPETIPEVVLRPISQLPDADLQGQVWRLISMVSPEGKTPTHTTASKIVRMVREVMGTKKPPKTLPSRELAFTGPVARLSKIPDFEPSICSLHIKTPEQAARISEDCKIVEDRCRRLRVYLAERYPENVLTRST